MDRIKSIALLSAVILAAGCGSNDNDWAPVGDRIKTRWAAEVSPKNAHTEYPRPQMIREDWKSLNGIWDYTIERASDTIPDIKDGHILVPFCLESSLSGAGEKLYENDILTYTTTFRIPSSWKGKKVMLNFGAVDYEAIVRLNGKEVGSHKGGYTAFSFDITPYLRKGTQTLEVAVKDATDNDRQPRGKQVLNPGSIWYTAVSGIWQTVWMEPVEAAGSIRSYYATTDIDKGAITVKVSTADTESGDIIKVSVKDGKRCVAKAKVGAASGDAASVDLKNPHLWTPDDPHLYDLEISLERNGKVIDEVIGYTAMRKISMVEGKNGIKRIGLNNEPIFNYGPLDQGWWPDGLYTAPTDEAMRYDLVVTKDCGFNMIRKHIKVEPATWYRACDEMGILVWQDMPSFADNRKNFWSQSLNAFDKGTDWPVDDELRATYYKEWGEIIDQLKGFPCIAVWVPFNEAWGQFETGKAVAFTKSMDNTRLVNGASGGNWVTGEMGDILDSHHYPWPYMRVLDKNIINVLGEYGGIGLPLEGHIWEQNKAWGYIKYETAKDATDQYVKYAEDIIPFVNEALCSGAVYTQTTDVEYETNGIMTYDREVIKLDPARLKEVNTRVINAMNK